MLRKIGLTLVLAFVAVLSVSAGTRKVYVTRHGQVGDKAYMFAATGEIRLTPLGEEQAKLLGEYLKKIGFDGTILASPIYRTMQTADAAAKVLGKKFVAEPGMQEYAPPKNEGDIFCYTPGCLTQEMIGKYFPDAIVPDTFVYPWRVKNETSELRKARVEQMLAKALTFYKGDLLFVGHGASVGAMRGIMKKRGAKQLQEINWNACLFVYTIDEKGRVIDQACLTAEYMPPEKTTNNFRCPLIPRPNDKKYEAPKSKK